MSIQKGIEINSLKNLNSLDVTEIDISNAIKITLPKFAFNYNENSPVEICSDFEINSEKISHIKTVNRPKGFKPYKTNDLKILRFIRYSSFVSTSHPYIKFNKENIEYKQVQMETPLADYFSHFKQSTKRNAYLVCFPNQNITLYDDKLNYLHDYTSSLLCNGDYQLKALELNNELTLFCFTCIDKAYLLNRNFEIFKILKVPYKSNFERRTLNQSNSANSVIDKHLAVLQLNNKATQSEIKSAFRKLIYQYHPDKNPNLKEAEEKSRELIDAYEFLSGQDISTVLDKNKKEEYYWVDKKHFFETEVNGTRLEINLSLEKPEDWIYGIGFSNDSLKVYLGCYSGKLYETNIDGCVDVIYIIPEDETCDRGGPTNPIKYVFENGNIKYILTHYYLYILENNVYVNHVKRDVGEVRWLGKYIVKQFDKELVLYDKLGFLLGNILLKTPIRHVCFDDSLLLIELTSKSILFKIDFD